MCWIIDMLSPRSEMSECSVAPIGRNGFLRALALIVATLLVALPLTGKAGIKPFLVQEFPPKGSPRGTTAYKFTDQYLIYFGSFKSVKVDDKGQIIFEDAPHYRGTLFKKQNPAAPVTSHITVIPGGYVDPSLIKS